MAIDDAYATLAQYHESFSTPGSGNDAVIERNLKSVSRYLDWKLGYSQSSFNKDSATSSRLYDGNDSPDLYVAPLASKAGLVVTVDDDRDGTFDHDAPLTAGEFELRPLNAASGPVPRPWSWLRLPERGSRWCWPRESLVKVEAKHGWPQVPDGIKDAAITLTAMFRDESIYATMQMQQIDQTVQASPQARAIVRDIYQQYRAKAPLVVTV